MMTESEALTKWCPHVRHQVFNDPGASGVNIEAKCIASACMMWEFAKTIPVYGMDGSQVGERREGDCGLKQTQRREG